MHHLVVVEHNTRIATSSFMMAAAADLAGPILGLARERYVIERVQEPAACTWKN